MPGLIVRQRRPREALNVLQPLPDLALEGHAVALRLPLPARYGERLMQRVQLLPHLARDRFANTTSEIARVSDAGHQRVGIEAIREEIEGHVLGRKIDRTHERSPEVAFLDSDVELEMPRDLDQTRDRDAALDVARHPVEIVRDPRKHLAEHPGVFRAATL